MHFRLLLLVCAFSLFSSNLLYVNEQSLNQLLESNEYLLVNLMFGMDDYESVSLQMELEKVRASISNYTLPKIQFAETDIKIEKNLTKKLKVQSKSGLILFKGKEELFIMEGARSESDILIWLKRMTNQLLFVEVNTDEEINKILEEKEAVILYIGSYSSDRFTIFNESAYLTRLEYQYGFAYTQNPVLLDKYETQKGIERVIVFTHYEPPKYYPGLFDAKEIRSFIFEASLSPFNELDDRVAQRIFGEEFPSMVLFGEQKEIDVFLHAVKVTKIYEKMLVTYTTGTVFFKNLSFIANELFIGKSGLSQRIMDLIGLKKEDMPCVWILVVNNEDILRYQMKGEIKEENIVYFFTQWIEGRLRGFLSSEDEWRAADKGPIKVFKTKIGKIC